MEFESWKRKFEGYCLLTHIRQLSPPEQRAALLAVLDDDWSRVVDFGLPLPVAASMDQIIDAMHTYLRRQRNVIIDRRDFTSRLQQPGETIDEYVCALKEIASCCDFCQHCVDDRFRDHIVVGTNDCKARRRMLETPDLTLEKALDICRASECATNNSSAIRDSVTVGGISRYRRERGRGRSGSAESMPTEWCRRCGATQHRDQRCPALDRTCNICHEHYIIYVSVNYFFKNL